MTVVQGGVRPRQLLPGAAVVADLGQRRAGGVKVLRAASRAAQQRSSGAAVSTSSVQGISSRGSDQLPWDLLLGP